MPNRMVIGRAAGAEIEAFDVDSVDAAKHAENRRQRLVRQNKESRRAAALADLPPSVATLQALRQAINRILAAIRGDS